MSIWVKVDSEQVYMNISGDVLEEHSDFLKRKLLERFSYGYRKMTLNVNQVRSFDRQAMFMLGDMQELIESSGGQFLIEDNKNMLKEIESL